MTLDFSQVAESKAKPKKQKSKSLALVPKLDIRKAQAQFAEYSKAIDGVVEEAQALQVIDDPSNKLAVTIGTQAKKLYNEIEKKRKEITEDSNTFVKSVNNFAKDFTVRLKDIETNLKQKISNYQYKQEMARREAERMAREEAAKLQKRLDEEARKKHIEAPVVSAPVIPKADKVTRTEDGGRSFQKMKWTFEILDEGRVPREYCQVNPSAIRQAITMGVREILGVRIFEESSTVFRTS